MLTKLKLENFKNFKEAELSLGPFTLLIGSNASGKSNIRDAFRFLHGVARGYSLAEVMGEKYGEGGELQWRGIRGGANEISYLRSERFNLTVNFEITEPATGVSHQAIYFIEVEISSEYGRRPRVVNEFLQVNDKTIFEVKLNQHSLTEKNALQFAIRIQPNDNLRVKFSIADQPALTQIPRIFASDRDDTVRDDSGLWPRCHLPIMPVR